MLTTKALLEKIDKEAKQKFGPNYRNWYATHDFPCAGGVFDTSLRWQDDTMVTVSVLEVAVKEGLNTVQDLQRVREKAQASGLWYKSTMLYCVERALLQT